MTAAVAESLHSMLNLSEGPERSEPGSVNIPVGKYPGTTAPLDHAQCDIIARRLVRSINDAIAEKKWIAIAALFLEEGYWRDHLATSWDLRTLKGPEAIASHLKANSSLLSLSITRDNDFQAPHFGPLDGVSDPQGITFLVNFESKLGFGRGVVRLAEEHGNWKIFTLFLTLERMPQIIEPSGHERPQGVQHGDITDRRNWQDRRDQTAEFADKDPTVLIIGAGQAGLTVAARLNMTGIATLAIDSNGRVGDSWRKRYHQLVLHDPVWFDHMPYIPFPKHWPIFSPKDKIAEWFEAYAKLMELNIWMGTHLLSSTWNEQSATWTIEVERTKSDGSKQRRIVHPRHIVLCTGHSGKINFPTMNGMKNFKGDLLCHSSGFPGAKENNRSKKAIVVGACNSGHDIAQDYYEKGYDPWNRKFGLKGLYDEDSPPVEDADVWLWGLPSEMLKAQQIRVSALQREYDAPVLQGLEKAGFKLDNGPSDSGLFIKYFQRGGGYYIDVGASQLIADGKIKIKQGQEIVEVLERGMRFADGSELEADEIVFATGYQNMRTRAREILGAEVADRVGDVWGFDREGEFRTMFRRSGHPGLWFHGGNMAICRYFSRLIALQIVALEIGLAGKDGTAVKDT